MLYSYLWNSFCHCASLIAFHGITCLLTTVQRKKNKKPTQVPCFNEPNYDTIRIHMLQNISSVNSSMIGFVATVRSCKQATWCLIDIIQSVHLTDREDMLYIFSSLLVHNFLPSFVGKNFFQWFIPFMCLYRVPVTMMSSLRWSWMVCLKWFSIWSYHIWGNMVLFDVLKYDQMLGMYEILIPQLHGGYAVW